MMTIYRSKLKASRLLMVLVLAYIQQASGGDELIIESAGVDTKKPQEPPQPLGKTMNLRGSKGTLAGQTQLRWKALLNKKSYIVSKRVDNITWVDTESPCTKCKVVVAGLVPETYSWFRVAGVTALDRTSGAPQSGWKQNRRGKLETISFK